MTPLEITCPACNAKPGEQCAGIVNAHKTLTEPHAARIEAARPPSDIEAAIRRRIARADADEIKHVQDRALIALNALPPAEEHEHVSALLVAAIGLCDTNGLSRADLVEMFVQFAKTLPKVAVR